ncbi:MAG: PEGA domain-containing protein, partial [Spirochaetes bacterium]|nr:PEGA domain-containing protein [Spirochaetota bacterium]
MKRIFLAAFVLAASYAFCSPWTSTPTITVEQASLGGQSSLSVRCDVRGAAVWLDYQARGSVPVDLTGLKPGSHLLVVRADGYYDSIMTISLAADTKTTVSASLELKTGFLDVRVDPPSARVVVDGASHAQGVIEVRAGQQTVKVEAFGYVEQSFSVFVPERLYASISATLQKAPFEAKDFSVSARRFNPRNAGLKGLARAAFSVSAEGSAEILVTGPDGRPVRRAALGPFTDWDQAYTWNGRSDDGEPVPDGEYAMEITVKPAEGVEAKRESYAFSSTLVVDSALISTPTGAYGAMLGSAYAPEAFKPALDSLRVEASGYARGTVSGAAAAGGFSVSAAGALASGVDAGLGFELLGEARAAGRLGARVSAPFSGAFGLAALAEGRVSDASAGNPAYARLGAAMGFGTPFFNAVAMPHIGAYWEEGLSARVGLGAAVNVSGYSFGASLSAAVLSSPLGSGF